MKSGYEGLSNFDLFVEYTKYYDSDSEEIELIEFELNSRTIFSENKTNYFNFKNENYNIH